MTPFTYQRASSRHDAVTLFDRADQPHYLGGGTNLVDLMRETIERPHTLVDVTGLSGEIEETADGGLLIGAGVRNTALAENRLVRERFPLVSRAVLAGASAQIRNMATVGGNILQRTRCLYFYDNEGARCNKRERGSGCDAMEGFTRINAVLGGSAQCIATHPSDMCVAMVAHDALVHLDGPAGTRTLPLADLHQLPGDTPDVETNLLAGELIAAVELPPLGFAGRSDYVKVRDRASYAFALVSLAAAIDVHGGQVRDVRLALGGMAPKPWRASRAEGALRGKPATRATFAAAADAELAAAVPHSGNAFKVGLARRVIVETLAKLTETQA